MDAETEARLLAEQAVWEEAIALVRADLTSTTSFQWTMRVTMHEGEIVLPRPLAGVEPVPYAWLTVRLDEPQLWLESDRWACSLDEGVEDLAYAIETVADRVQDELSELLRLNGRRRAELSRVRRRRENSPNRQGGRTAHAAEPRPRRE